MAYRIEKTVCILEKEVRIQCYITENGINVMLEGGDKGHIGAVAIVSLDVPMQVITFPTHKEAIVCQMWAEAIFEKYGVPVVVEAGIHYDNIGKEEIEMILQKLKEELLLLLKDMESEEYTSV